MIVSMSFSRNPQSSRNASKVLQRLTTSSDPSFRYHIPRRLALLASNRQPFSSYSVSRSSQFEPGQSASLHKRSTCQNAPVARSFKAVDHATSISSHFCIHRRNPQNTPLQNDPGWRVYLRTFHVSTKSRSITPEERTQRKSESENKTTSTSPTAQDGGDPSPNDHFYDRIPMPNFHRPTKEELLAAATGFWSRLRVRFKWLTIKSVRPYNMDEIIGFFSWIALGHVVWLIVGTTTFVSLAILAINTVFAQETLAGWIGNYLTKSTGLQVVFESAVVPKWKDGVITFKNVFVSRRPGPDAKSRVTKGSPEAAAVAAAQQDSILPEDQNYTQFDITLGEVNVTLSFNKWWNSKGLLKNVEIKHVRGVVDRTHVFWTGEELDPKSYRHEHVPGDFEIESFKIEDLLVTLHQPGGFRPFPVSIHFADLPRLRKQWLFYDFLCANNMTGEYDRSLFTIHPRQTHSLTGADLVGDVDSNEPWKKQSRIRLDGLNIEHLNRGVEGPFSWIYEGNVDVVADILIPNDNDESVMKVMSDFYDQIEAQFLLRKHHLREALERNNMSPLPTSINPNAVTQPTPIYSAKRSAARHEDKEDRRFLVMDLRVHLNDVRASVPLFTRDLSYVNNALVRPIVAYINSRRTFIPINCRVVKRITDFDGSWTIFDSGLMDDLSAETYEAFVRDITDEQARMRRFKKVGLWSLQLAVQAIFLGMAGNIA